jgi:undecaprenyl-diphosphatase
MPITIQAALLGVVQGLTEFLPVSSSAHLILARAFFGFDGDKFGLTFDVACHVGTLVAVLIYFRRDLGEMIAALPYLFRRGRLSEKSEHAPGRPASPAETPTGSPVVARAADARLIWLLAAGTIPAVVVGLLFKNQIEEHMRTPVVAAIALALGGIMLLVAERAGSKTRGERTLTMIEAVWIGCAQALALVPGVSRSGATLTVALLIGLRRADAARFIFLLAIPAILGAAASEAPRLLKAGLGDTASLFLIGIVTSAIVGYATVKYFIRYLGNHSLDTFAWYRIALAGAVAIWIVRT